MKVYYLFFIFFLGIGSSVLGRESSLTPLAIENPATLQPTWSLLRPNSWPVWNKCCPRRKKIGRPYRVATTGGTGDTSQREVQVVEYYSNPFTTAPSPEEKLTSREERVKKAGGETGERDTYSKKEKDLETDFVKVVNYLLDTTSSLRGYREQSNCLNKTYTALKSWWFWKKFLSLSGGLGTTAATFNIFTYKVWPSVMGMPENYTFESPLQIGFMLAQAFHAHIFLQIIYTSQGEQLLNSWARHYQLIPCAKTYLFRDDIETSRNQYRLLENSLLRLYCIADSLPGTIFLASRLISEGTYYTAASLFAYTVLNYYQRKILLSPVTRLWHSARAKKSENPFIKIQRQTLVDLLETKATDLRKMGDINDLYQEHFKSQNFDRSDVFLRFLFNTALNCNTKKPEPKGRKIISYLGYGIGLWGSIALFEGIKAFVSDGMVFLGSDPDTAQQIGDTVSGTLIGFRFLRNARNTSSMLRRLYDTATNFEWHKQAGIYNDDIHTHISSRFKFKNAGFSWLEGMFWSLPWMSLVSYPIDSAAFWMLVPAMLMAEGSFLGLQFDKDLLNIYRLKNTKNKEKKTEKRRTKILESISEIRNALQLIPSETIAYLYNRYTGASS